MNEDYQVQEIDEMQESERLPRAVVEWTNTFGEISRYNEYPAILAYFCLLGQILKEMLVIPYGFTKEDSRFHVCWIQTARSGKSVLNDFLAQVTKETFKYINAAKNCPESDPYFTTFDVVDYTDAALIGSVKTVRNEHYGEEGHPTSDEKEVEVQVYGALEGSGLALFDEFESSGIFKKSSHKENVVTYFAQAGLITLFLNLAMMFIAYYISKSLIDQIEGIGSIRKRALLNHFGSARAVESASLDEIKSVEGVEEKVAKKIYNFFHE